MVEPLLTILSTFLTLKDRGETVSEPLHETGATMLCSYHMHCYDEIFLKAVYIKTENFSTESDIS